MKRLAVSFSLGISLFAFAAMAQEFKGVIADSHCAAMKGAKAAQSDASCVRSCIKGGAKAVLVTPDGKIYKLSDQEKAVEHAGQKVTVEGKLQGDTITVESIKI